MRLSQEDISVSNIQIKELAKNSLKENQIGKKKYYKWNDWTLFCSATNAIEILNLYYQLILSKNIKSDYFSPIPSSGLTLLSGMLMSIGLTPLTYPKNSGHGLKIDFEFLVKKNSKVLIGDLAINTGTKLEKAITLFERANIEIAGVFFIVYNDTYPARFHPKIEDLQKSGKIHYLTTVSQLVEANSN